MVDKKTVEYVANLAKIKILPEEKNFFGSQLSRILDYIDKLKELDVEGVEPSRGLHLENNVFRPDEAISFSSREDILNNIPSREGNYFKIPKVIE